MKDEFDPVVTTADAEPKAERNGTAPARGGSKAAKGENGAAGPGGKKLVIVESPAKAKTIGKYLGGEFIVKASMGHIRDLPEGKGAGLGVDIANNFTPTYVVIDDERKRKVVSDLKKAAGTASEVFLATDPDREGEAIAWHLQEVLNVPADRVRRVTFNEITKSSVQKAFQNAGHVNMQMVNSQQTRRILDRIVGFEVSNLLWKKIQGGLSAGRVQSVAVRLIVEREREIQAFIPQESWSVDARFTIDPAQAPKLATAWREFLAAAAADKPRTQKERLGFLADRSSFEAELVEVNGAKFAATDAAAASAAAQAVGLVVKQTLTEEWPEYTAKGLRQTRLVTDLPASEMPGYAVRDLQQKPSTSRPGPPFTTATLQQAGVNRLGFTASRTMRVAQDLYEGIDLGEGPVGLITYMRTDSTNLSQDAIGMVRGFIRSEFGEKYLPEKPNFFASKETAQAAHEAIRPTDVRVLPRDLQSYLDKTRGKMTADEIRRREDQIKLYRVIWERFVACQMTPAVYRVTTALIGKKTTKADVVFRASGRVLEFDGYQRVAGEPGFGTDQQLPTLSVGQALANFDTTATQHWTSPPARFSEATLVKELESQNIGRPSTYASIIDTIQRRKYVELRDKRFFPTDIGVIVTDKLIESFPNIMDVGFTAKMEDTLDDIADENLNWVQVLHDFYGPFHETVENAQETMQHAKAEAEPSPYKCPTCGRPLVYRLGRRGRFLSCTGYDEIVGYKPPPLTKTGKVSKKKPEEIRACNYASPIDSEGKPAVDEVTEYHCEKCDQPFVKKKGRFGPYLACSGYPECKNIVALDKEGKPKPKVPAEPTGITCHKCGKGEFVVRQSKRGPFASCNRFPKCRNVIKHEKIPQLQEMTAKGEWPPSSFDAGEEVLGRVKKQKAEV